MCQWDWGDSFHCLAVSSFEVSSTLSPLCAVWTGSRFPQLRCHSCPKDTWNCGLTKLLQHPGFCFSYYPQPSSGYFQDSTGGEKCRSCSLGPSVWGTTASNVISLHVWVQHTPPLPVPVYYQVVISQLFELFSPFSWSVQDKHLEVW